METCIIWSVSHLNLRPQPEAEQLKGGYRRTTGTPSEWGSTLTRGPPPTLHILTLGSQFDESFSLPITLCLDGKENWNLESNIHLNF